MLNFSYTISPFLKKELETLQMLRDSVLLELMSPKDEMKMQWEAQIDRIYYSLLMRGERVQKKEIVRVLTISGKTQLKPNEIAIIGYKKSLDVLSQHWIYVPDQTVTIKDVLSLYSPIFKDFSSKIKDLTTILQFLQVSPEPPIIQSALAFAMVDHTFGNNDDSKRLATLMSYVFMYKNGYNFRNMVVFEEHFALHKSALEGALMGAYQRKNLSPFLDFFIFAVEDQVKKAIQKLKKKDIETIYPPGFFDLSERQKEIMAIVDRPGTRITNKMVQKQFKVSQITASRELAKLATLGLILSIGKGRSVYYTKA